VLFENAGVVLGRKRVTLRRRQDGRNIPPRQATRIGEVHVVRTRSGLLAITSVAALFFATPAAAQSGSDSRVNAGSPPSPFSRNKQNEPAVAVDQNHPTILAAGANDNIDMEACNAGPDNDCPFTPGVGVSGIYFSFNSGDTWTQPSYSGFSARNCAGTPGDSDPECQPAPGSIGTLPKYYESGLVSDGDPALAFGPVLKNGTFKWSNGSRLYYANLTSAFPGKAPFKGPEAIAVSRTDNVVAAAAGTKSAWSAPVIASKQNSTLFADKEQIWADNAAGSKFFGNVYLCYAGFRADPGKGNTPQPLFVLTSRDGGATWQQKQVTPAANNTHSRQGFGRTGCTVRTDSKGNVYVFTTQFGFNATAAAPAKILMITSSNGGATWSNPRTLFTTHDTCDYVEPSIGRCVSDGVAGARSDLAPAPSVDIANGAPNGTDANDRIVLSWVDGAPLGNERVMYATSANRGATWSTPVDVRSAGDRGYYTAPAISPNGADVYLVYNGWTTPFRNTAVGPFATAGRGLVGVVKHANGGSTAFTEIHRGTVGDARSSSQNNLAAEFLGDYVYAAATRSYGAAVWNDVREGDDCPAIDQYRQDLHNEAVSSGAPTAEAEEPESRREQGEDEPEAPPVQQACPPRFGNSDIFGGGFPDPTP
jgi:hypothetical protein